MRYHLLAITISIVVHAATFTMIFYASKGFSTHSKTIGLDLGIIRSSSDSPGPQPVIAGDDAAHRLVEPASERKQTARPKQVDGKNTAPRRKPAAAPKPRAIPQLAKRKPAAPLRQKAKPQSVPPAKTTSKKPAPRTKSIPEENHKIPPKEPEPPPPKMEKNYDRFPAAASDFDPLMMADRFPTTDALSHPSGISPEPQIRDEASADTGGEAPAKDGRDAVPSRPAGGYRTGGGESGDSKSAYYSSIRGRLRDCLHYPQIARKLGYSGRVVVSFTIHPDGTVDDITIKKSCGVSILDKSAIRTVKNAYPFPRPSQIARLVVPIVYRLN